MNVTLKHGLTGIATDGWFVEWVKILAGSRELTCFVNGWMDNGIDAAGPATRIVTCNEDGVTEWGKLCYLWRYDKSILKDFQIFKKN